MKIVVLFFIFFHRHKIIRGFMRRIIPTPPKMYLDGARATTNLCGPMVSV